MKASEDVNNVIFKGKKNRATIANSIIQHIKSKEPYCGRCYSYQRSFSKVKKELSNRFKIHLEAKSRAIIKKLTLKDMYREYKRLTLLISSDVTDYNKFENCLSDYFEYKFKKAVTTDGLYVADKLKTGEIKLLMDGTILNPLKYTYLKKIYKRLIPHYIRKECTAKYKNFYAIHVPVEYLKKYREEYSNNAANLQKKKYHDR